MSTTRPDRNVHDPLDWFTILDDVRTRLVDVEAIAHAAVDREPPCSDDPDTRRSIRRLCALVEATHLGLQTVIGEIDGVFARAMRLGDEMTALGDDDKTPIPE